MNATGTATDLVTQALGIGLWEAVLLAIVLVIVGIVIILVVKKILINTFLGVIALFLLNLAGLKIGYSIGNLITVALFGLFGVAMLVLLKLFGLSV